MWWTILRTNGQSIHTTGPTASPSTTLARRKLTLWTNPHAGSGDTVKRYLHFPQKYYKINNPSTIIENRYFFGRNLTWERALWYRKSVRFPILKTTLVVHHPIMIRCSSVNRLQAYESNGLLVKTIYSKVFFFFAFLLRRWKTCTFSGGRRTVQSRKETFRQGRISICQTEHTSRILMYWKSIMPTFQPTSINNFTTNAAIDALFIVVMEKRAGRTDLSFLF